MSRLSDLVERYRLWLFTRGWKLFSLSEWVFYLPGARHCPSCLATSVYPTGTQGQVRILLGIFSGVASVEACSGSSSWAWYS